MVNVKPVGSVTGTHAWHDLNMFNHVPVAPEMNAVKFEATRVSYCQLLMTTEDKVEDAITGNSLQSARMPQSDARAWAPADTLD